MKKKIYIAGKVTGEDRQACIDKFQKATDLVEIMGFIAVNPLEVVGDWSATWTEAMKKCLKALFDCDAVLLLDDWHFSEGAKLEHEVAVKLKLPIFSTKEPNKWFLKKVS
ncbi:DUF4406 domain-containing protein [Flavobacterium sp. GA093]|uniref:DUF4406 domain-containing protein n=1 Tax=Flavobacterium hydrocarbonoxydans TaxID=2683249 RepID=A0A6I4NGB3_9FLAO|nr:DUF4406 domain-containing protein [Flavobacterium hydrocarbonoxydans]MWB92963.1 DUF4406 domain-containing protein [Flavobacterium hydrocarbonoxydans]